MKISSKARYAVMALADLANHQEGGPVALSEISVRQDLPLPFLEQLFSKLRRAEIVASVRGSKGGYSLINTADKTRVFDVITAVDRPIKVTRCSKGAQEGCHADGRRCLTHDLWEELETVIQSFLQQVTLDDICQEKVAGLGKFGIFQDRQAHIGVQR